MAINTKQARKEACRKRQEYADNYNALFCSLFDNTVTVENADDLPKRYLLRVLRNKGAIAYHKQTGYYLPFVEVGIDIYGLPLQYTLIGYNGFNITCSPDEVVILRANDLKFPIARYFDQQVQKLVDYDMAIEQNLDSVKTTTIAEVGDEATLLALANEYEARRLGATVIFKNKNIMSGTKINVSQTGAEYLVDKLLEARQKVLNETLSTIGMAVANTDKRERVQSIEVVTSQGYALDCINTLIDTFNYDAEQGGIPIRLKGNTSLIQDTELQREETKCEIANTNNTNQVK